MLCRSERDVGSGRLVTVGANNCLVDAGPKVMNGHTHCQPLQNSLSLFISVSPPRDVWVYPKEHTQDPNPGYSFIDSMGHI